METKTGLEVEAITHKESFQAHQSANNLGSDELTIGDNLELVYQFIFDPRSDFSEITKLWSLTNLTQEDFSRLNSIAKTIRILDKQSFYHVVKKQEWTGRYLEDTETGKIFPQMIEKNYYESRFVNLIMRYKGEIDAICAGAGGRNASLIKGFRTAITKQEQQVEDKTDTKRSFFRRG